MVGRVDTFRLNWFVEFMNKTAMIIYLRMKFPLSIHIIIDTSWQSLIYALLG